LSLRLKECRVILTNLRHSSLVDLTSFTRHWSLDGRLRSKVSLREYIYLLPQTPFKSLKHTPLS